MTGPVAQAAVALAAVVALSATVVAVLVLVVVLAGWLSWTAQRLNRLHHRVEVARAGLEAHLLRRSGVTLELATSEVLDPASRLLLLDAAHRARSAAPPDQEPVESALSSTLRSVLGQVPDLPALRRDPASGPLLEELARACVRVELARRFHNDAVVAARALRARRQVRWLRLAGRAPEPVTVDLDAVPPTGLDPA